MDSAKILDKIFVLFAMFVFDMVIWYQVKKASEVKEKAESYFSAFIQHN